MAFPSIESVNPTSDSSTGGAATSGNTSAASHSVVLPATVSAGALLMVFGRVTVAGAVAVTGGGWTIVQDSSDGSDDVTFWMYRDALADGSEDGTTLTITHGTGKMAAVAVSITGAADPATRAPETSTVAVGTDDTVNPTTCTPTGGAKDYLWMWFGGWDGEQTLDKTAATNYTTNDRDVSTATASLPATNCQIKFGSRTNNAASEDPGSVTLSATAASGWTAWTIAVHPPSGTTFNRSPSDSVGASDSVLRRADALRSYTQPAGVSDAVLRRADALRQVANSAGFQDTATLAIAAAGTTFDKSYTDTVGLSNPPLSKTEVKDYQCGPDSVGASDSVLRRADALRLYTQSLGVSDALLRRADALRSYLDTLAASDAVSRRADALRQYAEAAGLSDTAARRADALRVYAEALGLSDAATLFRVDGGGGGTTFNRSLTETLGVSDSAQRLVTGLRALADTVGVSDAAARRADALRALSDTLAASDSALRVATLLRALTETAGVSDVALRQVTALRQYTDSAGVADAFARVVSVFRLLTDTLGLSDAAALLLVTPGIQLIAVSDTVGLADAFARRADALRLLVDTLAAADTVLRRADAARLYADSVAVSDAVARVQVFLRTLSETVGLAEAYARRADAARALAETVGAADAAQRIADAIRLYTEAVGLSDLIQFVEKVYGVPFVEAALALVLGADRAGAGLVGAEEGQVAVLGGARDFSVPGG